MKLIISLILITISVVGIFTLSIYDISVGNQKINLEPISNIKNSINQEFESLKNTAGNLPVNIDRKMNFDEKPSIVNLIKGHEIQHRILDVSTSKIIDFGHAEYNGKKLENGKWLVILMEVENLSTSKTHTFGGWYKVIDSKNREFLSVTSDGNLERHPPKGSHYNFELLPGIPQERKIGIQIPEDEFLNFDLLLQYGHENRVNHKIGNISYQ